MAKFQIMKLVYLLEVEAYKFVGEGFFGTINFQRDKNGPISINVYNALDNLQSRRYIGMKISKRPDYPHPRHCYFLNKLPQKIDLGDSEKIFLNSVLESYIDMSIKRLKEITYLTEPMKEILKKEESGKKGILKRELLDLDCISIDEELAGC